MGAQTLEANNNAGVAAANQIVGFFEKGDVRFQVESMAQSHSYWPFPLATGLLPWPTAKGHGQWPSLGPWPMDMASGHGLCNGISPLTMAMAIAHGQWPCPVTVAAGQP